MTETDAAQHITFSVDRLARLVGVTIGTSEPVPETLTFHLRMADGDELALDLHTALAAIGFACKQRTIPRLSDDWVGHVVSIHDVDTLWSSPDDTPATETDITSLLLFEHDGRSFWVSPGTLVQCLQIAAHESRVPPLDADWLRRAIPEGYAMPARNEEPLARRPAPGGTS